MNDEEKSSDQPPRDATSAYAEAVRLAEEARQIQASELDLSSLRTLERLPKLSVSISNLDISGTKIVDLSPLQGLELLAVLDLSGTPVRELSPLSQLTAPEGPQSQFNKSHRS